MNWVEIGARIRSQREAFGYTRETFAEMLDVTPKFCADIELGKKGMSVPTLCRIASVLKLSTDYILFGGPIVKENLDKEPISCEKKRMVVFILFCFLLTACSTVSKDESVSISFMHGWGGSGFDHVGMRELFAEFEALNPDAQ